MAQCSSLRMLLQLSRRTTSTMINYAGAIRILAECGDVTRAMEMEHEAIDALLFVLNKTMQAGASSHVIMQVVELIEEFYCSHVVHEEEYLQNKGVDVTLHAEAHCLLVRHLQRVRSSLAAGNMEATLDIVDLLDAMRNHAEKFDKAAFNHAENDLSKILAQEVEFVSTRLGAISSV